MAQTPAAMNVLFLEPFGGMAGDMLLAALLDLGDPRFTLADLEALAESLVPGEASFESQRVWRGSLSGHLLDVRTPESADPPHRHYADLEQLVRASSLGSEAQDLALSILWCIAEAEARVHDTTPEEIHFHEVGAVDTLIDVCGAVLALERLGYPRVYSTAPLVGSGTVHCAHGEMPVPAPAVAEILRGRAQRMGGGGERLTPTGAAVLVSLCPEFGTPSDLRVQAIGYGAGRRDPEEGPPNLVRVQLGEERGACAGVRRGAWQMEVHLDDMTGEELGWLCEALREAGALDVWSTPLYMKKGRPGVLVALLCREEQRTEMERVAFERSSTFGVRWTAVERLEAERAWLTVEVGSWSVRVKVRLRPGASGVSERDLAPEYEDLVAASGKDGAGGSLRELGRRAVAAALARIESGESPFVEGLPSA